MEFEENLCYEQAENPDIFPVTIVENTAADRCSLRGTYEFHVNTMNFALVELKAKKPVYIWPFRYVRRYGRSPTNFQFEAGRKCPSGEGLFSLLTEDGVGENIFQTVQSKFSKIKLKDKEYGRQNSQVEPSPSLPARQYENNSAIKIKPQQPPSTGVSSTSPAKKPKPLLQKPSIVKRVPVPVLEKHVGAPPFSTEKAGTPSACVEMKGKPVDESERVAQEYQNSVSASHINKLIVQNKKLLSQGMEEDSTYNTVGELALAAESSYSTTYGDLYSQKKATGQGQMPPEDQYATYDEIRS